MAHAAASIKKVREAELDEKEKILERERKKQRKVPRDRADRKRKVRGASPDAFPGSPPRSPRLPAGLPRGSGAPPGPRQRGVDARGPQTKRLGFPQSSLLSLNALRFLPARESEPPSGKKADVGRRGRCFPRLSVLCAGPSPRSSWSPIGKERTFYLR